MTQQFKDNARGLLSSSITDTATSITLESGSGDLFPVANADLDSLPSANDWFKATLQDASGEVEIVYVRTRSSGSSVFSNVLRGQEGTTARAWDVGSVVGLRMTAADVQEVVGATWANIPQSAKGAPYTLQYTDGGTHISSTTGDVTVPAGVFNAGDVVCVYNNSAASINIVRDGGVTLWWVAEANADRVLQPRGLATILCVGANEFVITGQGVS